MPSGALTFRTGGSVSSGSGDSIKKSITQSSHGFAVGECVYYTGSVWAKAKADSVVTAEVIGVIDAVADVNTFSVTMNGYISTLSGLVAGTIYFLSDATAGLMTATEPTTINYVSKPVLVAISTTAGMVLPFRGQLISGDAAVYPPVNNAICQGRLTLESGVAISTTDQTSKTTIYFTPYNGNNISLYNGSNWATYTFTERSLALGTLTSGKNYDVFIYNNSGTLTLEFSAAWTSDTARNEAISLQDGVYVKTSANTRRYLGTFYTTSTTTTEDSVAKRFCWNAHNQIQRFMKVTDTTNSWSYTTATWRSANNSATNRLQFTIGLTTPVTAQTLGFITNGTACSAGTGVGVDSTTVNSAQFYGGGQGVGGAGGAMPIPSKYSGIVTLGYHYLQWLELSQAVGTTTWYGDGGSTIFQSGIVGEING